MTKILSGRDIADYMKTRQFSIAQGLKSQKITPTLAIIRDNSNPVIDKYVNLKKRYGEDISVSVLDIITNDVAAEISRANQDPNIHGIIIQLPLEKTPKTNTQELLDQISPEKDVDGLGENAKFDSATATAIHWLLTSYNIELSGKKIAIVGRGKLVGAPLAKIFTSAGYDFAVFSRQSNLQDLINYDIIITATGQPSLITSNMVKPSAVIIDAGTASDKGKLVGDVSPEVRARTDLAAITPELGGVGPLTVATLFEHLLAAASR